MEGIVALVPEDLYDFRPTPEVRSFREQFTHVAALLDRHDLAYLHVVDGLAFGFHQLGEPMTLPEFRRVFRGPLMGNCGYTFESAEQAVRAGDADLIAFGRPFISNPDPEVMRDGDYPPEGNADELRQYDTIHVSSGGVPDKNGICWMGYAFPTDLDRDPPVDGLAPPSQADVVRRALGKDWTPDELNARLAEHAARRHG